MMSSETSTDAAASSFRPWHFFVLAGLVGATITVVTVRPNEPAALVLLVLAVGAGAYVGFGLYRAVMPLTVGEVSDRVEMIGGRTRAALEREKTLVLRSIKELEFDHAMGKVSADDFREMGGRLRTRARALLKRLDVDGSTYRDLIERELAARLEQVGLEPVPDVPPARPACASCGTINETDSKFCKECGAAL